MVKVGQKNKYPCTLVEIQSCWLNPPSDIDGDWDELWSERWPRPPVLPHLPNSPFITFFHPLSAPQCRWRRKWNIFLSSLSLSASEGSTWMEWDGNCRKSPIIITRGYLINISNCWVSKYFFSLLLCGSKFPKNLLLIGIFQSTTRWWHKNFRGINITLIIGHEKFQQQFFQETPRKRIMMKHRMRNRRTSPWLVSSNNFRVQFLKLSSTTLENQGARTINPNLYRNQLMPQFITSCSSSCWSTSRIWSGWTLVEIENNNQVLL